MKKIKMIMALMCVMLFTLSACGSSAGTNATVTETPVETPEADEPQDGVLSVFEAVGLDGKNYDQTVLEGHKITMINVWGTFCGPCIKEMPYLGDFSREYDSSDFQIIGIICDAADREMKPIESALADARDIISDTKADYLHLLPSESLTERVLYYADAVPLTFFVNEKGEQVGDGYVGSRDKKSWKKIINELLESVK